MCLLDMFSSLCVAKTQQKTHRNAVLFGLDQLIDAKGRKAYPMKKVQCN